jgi:hypothetical protein
MAPMIIVSPSSSSKTLIGFAQTCLMSSRQVRAMSAATAAGICPPTPELNTP